MEEQQAHFEKSTSSTRLATTPPVFSAAVNPPHHFPRQKAVPHPLDSSQQQAVDSARSRSKREEVDLEKASVRTVDGSGVVILIRAYPVVQVVSSGSAEARGRRVYRDRLWRLGEREAEWWVEGAD